MIPDKVPAESKLPKDLKKVFKPPTKKQVDNKVKDYLERANTIMEYIAEVIDRSGIGNPEFQLKMLDKYDIVEIAKMIQLEEMR